MNTFSSPIKIPEYLAAGCPVLLGAHVGDFSELVRGQGLGVVAGEHEAADALAGRIWRTRPDWRAPSVRSHCVSVAAEHFGLRSNLRRYSAVYEAVLDSAIGADLP